MKKCWTMILVICTILSAQAEDTKQSMRTLDIDNGNPTKFEVWQSMMGYRNTAVFYTFKDKKAVLQLVVGNKDTKFPVKATIVLFPEATTADGLKKWLNNQHSDALYPDAAQPEKVINLPDNLAESKKFKALKTTEHVELK